MSQDSSDREPNLGRTADRLRDGKEKRKLRYRTRPVVESAGSGSSFGAKGDRRQPTGRQMYERMLGEHWARGLLKPSVARKIGAKRDKR